MEGRKNMKTYIESIKKSWNGKELNEKDYNNLCDLMIIAIVWIMLWIVL